jgi:hypothetical protein
MTSRHDWGRPLELDAQPGPARRISAARGEEMVNEAIRRAQVPPGSFVRIRPERALQKAAGWGVLLVALFATGSAGAVFLVAKARWAAAPPSASVERPLRSTHNETAPHDSRPSPQVDRAPEDLPSAAPQEQEQEQEPAVRVAPAHEQSAEELLRKANELRAKHRWMEATHAYEQTMRWFPGSAEAYSATVAAGFLHLDHLGDARGALRLLNGALRMRPEGALSEEVRWGRIEAFRALGAAASEQGALRDFVGRYPKSLFITRADARLRDLAEAP